MAYKEAMKAAGATVMQFEEFGSYQGEWVARVDYNGQTRWIIGSYGSCSGCDAFEAEFGFAYEDEPDVEERLARFGQSYLNNNNYTQAEAEAYAKRYEEWGDEYADMLVFLREHAIT